MNNPNLERLSEEQLKIYKGLKEDYPDKPFANNYANLCFQPIEDSINVAWRKVIYDCHVGIIPLITFTAFQQRVSAHYKQTCKPAWDVGIENLINKGFVKVVKVTKRGNYKVEIIEERYNLNKMMESLGI